ncbi:hypothetical protein [Teredinibacter haidensis]|uniref:hypothetical protein n=1 Tax=Teredinibacter haidensis TaxID=2731755 RepID=UPI000948A90C|nr:hypothetical protein [Teredinibacter haidensis]
MARILFVWEMGFGLGHIIPIKHYCDSLQQHELFAAVQSLQHAHQLVEALDVKLLQAPHFQGNTANPVSSPRCYAHLLHNSGFSTANSLAALMHAWRTLFQLVQPDIVIFDHSPSALLAARAFDFKKVVMGSGFLCPPQTYPMAVFLSEQLSQADLEKFKVFETELVVKINTVLQSFGCSQILQLSDIYKTVDASLLTAYPELDHFPSRSSEQYVGVPPTLPGKTPNWTNVKGKKIFVYSHMFPQIKTLLYELRQSGVPVIFCSSSVDPVLLNQFECDNICFESDPLDLQLVAKECAFAVTNGNFNSASQLALLGIPQLAIPLQMEQLIFSKTLFKSSLASIADPGKPESISKHFREMLLYSDTIRTKVEAFAAKYRSRLLSPADQLRDLITSMVGNKGNDIG